MAEGVLGEETKRSPKRGWPAGERREGGQPDAAWGAGACFHAGAWKHWTKDRSTVAARTGWQEGRPPF